MTQETVDARMESEMSSVLGAALQFPCFSLPLKRGREEGGEGCNDWRYSLVLDVLVCTVAFCRNFVEYTW